MWEGYRYVLQNVGTIYVQIRYVQQSLFENSWVSPSNGVPEIVPLEIRGITWIYTAHIGSFRGYLRLKCEKKIVWN